MDSGSSSHVNLAEVHASGGVDGSKAKENLLPKILRHRLMGLLQKFNQVVEECR